MEEGGRRDEEGGRRSKKRDEEGVRRDEGIGKEKTVGRGSRQREGKNLDEVEQKKESRENEGRGKI